MQAGGIGNTAMNRAQKQQARRPADAPVGNVLVVAKVVDRVGKLAKVIEQDRLCIQKGGRGCQSGIRR